MTGEQDYCGGDPGPHEPHEACRGVPAQPRSPARCEARATKGTGQGTCDRLLDERGQCDRAGAHV